MARRKVGIWIVGAQGGVATTVALGLTALKKGLAEPLALVSEAPQFKDLGLAEWSDFVVGGHEIRKTSLWEEVVHLREKSHLFDERLISKCKSELRKIDTRIRLGTVSNVGKTIESLAEENTRTLNESPLETIERLRGDMQAFAAQQRLERVVVLNLASTEPPHDIEDFPSDWTSLAKTLNSRRKCKLPASSMYAIAAFEAGFPYLNFTPSLGSSLPALQELAILKETCHMGHDGKTGETLMKSVLAPMFASRQLEVMSWVGHNIFGNMDGKVLNDPENKKTKVVSKDRLLHQILGYDPQTLVGIEYIESLGDWKTAWDHIHFRGFLGTPMVMQFIWQGCDSLLAAPLALDLVRLTECAYRNGSRGLLPFLASFFKSPIGVEENGFIRQFQMLEEWAAEVRSKN